MYEWAAVWVWLLQMRVKWSVGRNLCFDWVKGYSCACGWMASVEHRNPTPALCLSCSSAHTDESQSVSVCRNSDDSRILPRISRSCAVWPLHIWTQEFFHVNNKTIIFVFIPSSFRKKNHKVKRNCPKHAQHTRCRSDTQRERTLPRVNKSTV